MLVSYTLEQESLRLLCFIIHEYSLQYYLAGSVYLYEITKFGCDWFWIESVVGRYKNGLHSH